MNLKSYSINTAAQTVNNNISREGVLEYVSHAQSHAHAQHYYIRPSFYIFYIHLLIQLLAAN